MANNRPNDLNFLYDIMNDLYGNLGTPASKEELDKARAAVSADFAAEGAKVQADKAAPAAPVQPETVEPAAPQLPPFESFWRTADDSVDWTDALLRREPNDGLTDPELWHFYHEQA